ncbi:PilZ domain-containing protein [Magnetococcus sp. PR-3]|uniref:PilZ domain-containing protein n=1 Tax=Magnetococcus sp. PR-3 TaxID=3120355 RepID=UPI002FCE5FF2
MSVENPQDRRSASRRENPNGRRQFTRVEYHHAMMITDTQGNTYDGTFQDISLKGMLFLGDNLPAEGLKVTGKLPLGDVIIELNGDVVFSNAERGAAIKFTELDLESFSHLRTLVSLNAGDAERIDRELFDAL